MRAAGAPGQSVIDNRTAAAYMTGSFKRKGPPVSDGSRQMRIANSMKSLKKRHRACRLIKRKGRIFVINKENPRFKARQG